MCFMFCSTENKIWPKSWPEEIYMYSIYRQQVPSLHNTHSLGHKILSQEEKITKKISFFLLMRRRRRSIQTEYESFSYQIHLFFLQSSRRFKSGPKCVNDINLKKIRINLLLITFELKKIDDFFVQEKK